MFSLQADNLHISQGLFKHASSVASWWQRQSYANLLHLPLPKLQEGTNYLSYSVTFSKRTFYYSTHGRHLENNEHMMSLGGNQLFSFL